MNVLPTLEDVRPVILRSFQANLKSASDPDDVRRWNDICYHLANGASAEKIISVCVAKIHEASSDAMHASVNLASFKDIEKHLQESAFYTAVSMYFARFV